MPPTGSSHETLFVKSLTHVPHVRPAKTRQRHHRRPDVRAVVVRVRHQDAGVVLLADALRHAIERFLRHNAEAQHAGTALP